MTLSAVFVLNDAGVNEKMPKIYLNIKKGGSKLCVCTYVCHNFFIHHKRHQLANISTPQLECEERD